MTTNFIQNGDVFRAVAGVGISPVLPAATYVVMLDQQGYFLQRVDDMTVPSELYGDLAKNAQRVLTTFQDRTPGVGVLLSGEKGSGKTLFAKQLSVGMRAMGHPTIIVNQAHSGDGFNALIKSITQPAMFFYDEFEKIYHDKNVQSMMLSLLDGFAEGKRLNVVTVNDFFTVHDMMKNRPGRFFYHLKYDGLEEEFIRDYCAKNLKRDGVEEIVRFAGMFYKFNFDILKALVEEMNRYDEPLVDVIKFVNADPGLNNGRLEFDVVSYTLKKADPKKWVNVSHSGGPSPLLYDTTIYLYDANWDSSSTIGIAPDDIVAVAGQTITFSNDEIDVVIKPKMNRGVDYTRFIL